MSATALAWTRHDPQAHPKLEAGPIDRHALDRIASPISIVAFSVALGIGYIALPLFAIASGYDAAMVGLFLAISAVIQIFSRLFMAWLLARLADRWMIGFAASLLAISYGLLVVSTSVPVYVVSMIGLGAARAFYWTSSQTHAVRRGDNTVRALALMNTTSSLGTVVGPFVGGVLIGISHETALAVAAGASALAAIAAFGLVSLPTYDRGRPEGAPHVWRRPGVDIACWASFTAGGWRALLTSYVPVVLVAAGQVPTTIGVVLSLAEAMAIGSAAALVRFSRPPVRAGLVASSLVIGVSLAVVPFVADHALAAAVLLALSGAGGGIVTTLGPALAAQSVPVGQLAAAMSVTGTFRALGLLVLPTAVAAGLAILPIAPAVALAGLGIGAPTVLVQVAGRRRRREAPPVS